MRIVFAVSEAIPFVKTGGLGDVGGSLPRALTEAGDLKVTVFLPHYRQINEDISVEPVGEYETCLGWRKHRVELYRVADESERLSVYLIGNANYFDRPSRIYGHIDDGERFAFFSKAILDGLCYLGLKPDIIHCNDWQTALIPIFLHAWYADLLGAPKTVYTIHNIEYQGWARSDFFDDVLSLPEDYRNVLDYHNAVNFMKGGIISCDALTTVSRTYANELQHAYFACGLDGIIREHQFKLSGIVNGIDMHHYDPQAFDFGAENWSGKEKCKRDLRLRCGLTIRDAPIMGVVSRLAEHKGIELLCQAVPALMAMGIQLVVLGSGEDGYEKKLSRLSEDYRGEFSYLNGFSEQLAKQIYAGIDFYVMPSKSEPCGLSQLIAMRYGSVPIVHAVGGLKDTVLPFNVQSGEGCGFTFQSYTVEDFIDAVDRAVQVYWEDSAGWAKVRQNAISADHSWVKSAREYIKLYYDLIRDTRRNY